MAGYCSFTQTQGVSSLDTDVVSDTWAQCCNLTHANLDVGTDHLAVDSNVVILNRESTVGVWSTPASDNSVGVLSV